MNIDSKNLFVKTIFMTILNYVIFEIKYIGIDSIFFLLFFVYISCNIMLILFATKHRGLNLYSR